MALDVGTLVAFLKVDDSGFTKGIDGAQSKMAGFGKFIGTAVVAGTVAAAAAVTAFAVKGIAEFATFEKGMNEVFTLLPGISEEAMGQMNDDTRKFVREMGVAHEEAVPALYSALSAGVPADNVFSFMETAAKASKGGVTDMNTAVSGISSVVNAYGDSISGAGEASDLMFTAVRLGQTTFEELSASLFQVNPVASSLGVKFGDVTAALATMTSVGVPTSVATTQLRAAMVELSQDGGKTSEMFKELSGKTFKQFIAEGGNTGDALQLLADHAEKTGVGVNDLFGSVEAGGAALALTGANNEKFNASLGEMNASAGATDAAFQQMDRGLARSWDKIQIGVTDAALGFGEKLAPAVAVVSDWVGDKLPKALEGAGDAVSGMIDWLTNTLPSAIQTAIAFFGDWRGVLDSLTPYFNALVAWLDTNLPGAFTTGTDAGAGLVGFLASDLPIAIQGAIGWFEDWGAALGIGAGVITLVVLPAFIRMAIAALVSAATTVTAWVMTEAAAIKAAAVYVVQTFVIIGRWIAMSAAAVVSGAITVAIWALYAVEAVKGAIVYGIQSAYVIGAWVAMSTAAVVSGIKTAAVWVGSVIASAVSGAVSFLVQTAIVVGGWVAMSTAALVSGAKTAAVWTGTVVASAASAAGAFIAQSATVIGGWVLMGTQSLIQGARMAAAWLIAMGPVGWVIAAVVGLVALIIANWSSVSRFTSEAWSNVTRFVADAWRNITSGVSSGIGNVVSFVSGMPGKILGALGNMGSLLLGAGGQIIEGFLSGLRSGFESVKNFVGGIGDWIAANKGPKAYDLALLVPAGGWIMTGLDKGLKAGIPGLKKTLGSVSATIQSGVTGGSVGLTGSGSALAGSSTDNRKSITYAPVFQAGPDFREQERLARTRFMDTLNVYV